jgi:2-keto-3-deoxy-L-rhamnonate aldolase RhmA
LPKTLRSLLRRREPAFGTFVGEFDTPGMGHILANAGCDFAFLDMEHSGFTLAAIKSAVRYYEAAGVSLIVRAPSKSHDHISRVLDAGAEGVCLACVGTPDEAREIVAAAKYPPAGARGIGLQLAHDDYARGAVAAKLAAANRQTCVLLQIESAEGAENAEAIAAVAGVDALWIGHNDLSASLGIAGQFAHPDFLTAVRRVIAACAKHRRALGMVVGSPEQGLDMIGAGFNLITYSGDAWLLRDALAAGIAAMRDGARARSESRKRSRR